MKMMRSIKFYQRNVKSRCDAETLQMPITFYKEEDGSKVLSIKHVYIPEVNMAVPYLAYQTKRGYLPLEISENIFNIPIDWKFKKKMKMRWFRRFLPNFIGYQYFIAEMIKVEGYDSVQAIESGEVIRNLRDAIETRLKLKHQTTTWDVIPGFVPAGVIHVC